MSRHSSGQARVTIEGKVHYLGAFGTLEAQERYAHLVRTWLEHGPTAIHQTVTAAQAGLKVRELLQEWLNYLDATGRYHKGGRPTSQRVLVRTVCASFSEFVGTLQVAKLTEAVVLAWRERIETNRKLTRGGINRKLNTLLMPFRWGKQRGMVPKIVWAELKDIEPLRRGEVGDRPERGRQRRAVTRAEVELVAAQASPQVAAMLRLQALTGMRPGEVLALRWADIEQGGVEGAPEAWVYRVAAGKTAHHGHQTRYVFLDAAQSILRDWPALPAAYVFSPAASMAARSAKLRTERKSPLTAQTALRDAKAKKTFAARWGLNEYRIAVLRACDKAGVARFTPHEVRHGFITEAVEREGLLAASAAANHVNITTTQRYVHARPEDVHRVARSMQSVS